MIAFIVWYLLLTLLGWLAFPLVYRLFPALADRGYTLARAAGLLLWAYVFWLFTTLGLSFNNVAGILFGLLPLLALSLYALFVPDAQPGEAAAHPRASGHSFRDAGILHWVRDNARLVVTTEALFLVAFALLALLRAGNPTLDNAEKPMELMFINSILRSPSFPPHDGWLSGYAISYYYFGYVMTAMLAQLSGVTGSIAHNLMTALVFALAAIGAYGLLFNLMRRGDSRGQDAAGAALLAPLFMLVVSNIEGFLEVLHRRGILWTGTRNFWTWLDIRELNQAPAQPLGWIPDRFWWWWRASRVISDYDLPSGAREVIDEFPFFSFLHADLHPHVLAIPFILLTIAVALNIFLGGRGGETKVRGLRLRIDPPGFMVAALVLGGLAFVNIWDILLGAALIVLAYGLLCARLEGWSWNRLTDMLALAVPLAVSAALLYLPFYFGFASQAGGLLPNLVSPTRGAQLWVMFAPLFIPLLSYHAYLLRGERRSGKWGLALLIALGLVVGLLAAALLVAWIAAAREPGLAEGFLQAQGVASFGALIGPALVRRLTFIGGVLTMLAVFVPALAYLAAMRTEAQAEIPAAAPRTTRTAKDPPASHEIASQAASGGDDRAAHFGFLLVLLASLLVLGPEFVYLRDQFGYRLNTIFKFYFQAWLLWSIPAALAVAILLRKLHGAVAWFFMALVAIVLVLSLTYPALSVGNKTNGFKPPLGWTLDDFKRIERNNSDEAAALLWLRNADAGVIAEAVGGSYTDYGRVSVYTGLPAVLGWPGHEVQWRGTADPQGSRQDDLKLLYETPDWESARLILDKYDIRYVYVGGLERSTYQVQEEKFLGQLGLVFQHGAVSIYEVP
jgi:YYY domain-containing protein